MSQTIITNKPKKRRGRRANVQTTIVQTPAPNSNTVRNRQRRLRKRAVKRLDRQIIPMNDIKIRNCTLEYASALVNPFGTRATMPCIPDNVVIPSYKLQTKCRGVFSTGTMGLGFVLFDPWKMCYKDGSFAGTFSTFPLLYSGSPYAQANVNWQIAGGVPFDLGMHGANSNSLFNAGDLEEAASNRQIRLVAAGLKIQYVGSNLYNQGRVTIARVSGNANFPTTYTGNDLLIDNYTNTMPVSRKSEYTFYTPDDHSLLSYHPLSNYVAANGGVDHFAYTIVIEGGSLTNPQSWAFEAVAYFEIIGRALTLSPSHSDVENMGHALESLPVRNPSSHPKIVENSVFTKLTNLIKSSVSNYGPMLARAGLNYLTGYPTTGSQNLLTYPTITEVDD
jgi:hypothetical protein